MEMYQEIGIGGGDYIKFSVDITTGQISSRIKV